MNETNHKPHVDKFHFDGAGKGVDVENISAATELRARSSSNGARSKLTSNLLNQPFAAWHAISICVRACVPAYLHTLTHTYIHTSHIYCMPHVKRYTGMITQCCCGTRCLIDSVIRMTHPFTITHPVTTATTLCVRQHTSIRKCECTHLQQHGNSLSTSKVVVSERGKECWMCATIGADCREATTISNMQRHFGEKCFWLLLLTLPPSATLAMPQPTKVELFHCLPCWCVGDIRCGNTTSSKINLPTASRF
ncbi:unnamed protein product [Ceratitis capitata]|uniref:(Mediterranean fruit fly) hypothetical protein n=1 Tax=Ceratitis capitata TaxID=7213 RepID=A0A811UCA8_CERCA|nr:unnamed protein product [Ceratitis capitata]